MTRRSAPAAATAATLSCILAALLAVSLTPAAATAQESTRLLRQPTVSTTHVAFAYAGDIWIAGRDGGDARRVTAFEGVESLPHFSPDGRWIAFTGSYAGNDDVYVVAAAGGEPRRLTWHPGPDLVRGWTNDGTAVVFGSGRTSAPVPYSKLWTVAIGGGEPRAMVIPRAVTGDFSPDGRRFAYQPIELVDGEWRNYRGGQMRPIWVLDLDDHELETLPWDNSVDTQPVWMDGTIYFLSDRDLANNVWAYDVASKQLRQVTRHADYDVKSLAAGGGVVAYEQGGWIHLWDPATATARRLDITVRGDLPWARPRWVDVAESATGASLSPTGVRALFEARGDIFTVPTDKGDWRNLTNSTGVADRSPVWSPDGERVAWFSDRGGEYRLVIGRQDGLGETRSIELPGPTFYYTPAWSPDGERIALTDTDLNLWLVDLDDGDVEKVDQDTYPHPFRTFEPVWSPDSRWIAYAKRLDNQFHAVMVHDTETGRATQVTDGLSDAISPAWDRSGKYLWFLASTDFALNTAWLDMSSYERPVRRAVYLAVLAADEPSPLLPQSDEEAAVAADANGSGSAPANGGQPAGAGRDTAGTPAVRIDFDGIGQRILSIGVPARDYQSLRAGPDGTVFWLEDLENQPLHTLHRWQLKERKAAEFMAGVQTYTISADGKKLLYNAGPTWGVVDTDKAPPKPGDGRLALESLRVRVDPRAEWEQMFREAWRYQRDYLYVQNLHGADWPAIWRLYEPWVEDIGHRADLSYLLDILGGEVAVGHSFVFGGDEPEVEEVPVGLLGADLEAADGRYRIARIYTGENWNPELRAPLSAPGIEVAEGDYILAVNGVELTADQNPYGVFEGTADRQTVLRVNDRPTLDGSRAITVVPLASETVLRSRAWVEDNRRRVDELSGGRLAYVYVPNTSNAGYTYFNRYYFAQQHKQGAVIDERFNGGGSAADYMVDIMARRLHGFFNSTIDEARPFTTPGAGIWGPKVMIINESAGSGGDLLPYMFRNLGIGPLVGTTTWGGLVGIWDVPPLIDGGAITAPRGGFYTVEGEWAVENEGVAPDIHVEQTPAEVIAGRDPQLEAAVAEALRLLEAQGAPRIMPEPDEPVRAVRPSR